MDLVYIAQLVGAVVAIAVLLVLWAAIRRRRARRAINAREHHRRELEHELAARDQR